MIVGAEVGWDPVPALPDAETGSQYRVMLTRSFPEITLKHCVEHHQSIAAMVVVVDAINDEAARFYRHFNFQSFPETPDKLFITMKLLTNMLQP
jgi:hypothetical protein